MRFSHLGVLVVGLVIVANVRWHERRPGQSWWRRACTRAALQTGRVAGSSHQRGWISGALESDSDVEHRRQREREPCSSSIAARIRSSSSMPAASSFDPGATDCSARERLAAIPQANWAPDRSRYSAVYGAAGCTSCGAHSVRVDPQGNIWVVDATGHVIYKLNQDGKEIMRLGTKGTFRNQSHRRSTCQPTSPSRQMAIST